MGDHVYRKDEIFRFSTKRTVLRPANFPPEAPGAELAGRRRRRNDGCRLQLLGRTFMKPAECPFRAADRVLELIGGRREGRRSSISTPKPRAKSSCSARYLDGRVSAVLGTHTHVATADEQILQRGTAYQTDVGMTGPHDSILGRRYDRVFSSTLPCTPTF